jgi:hypothetical protein
MYSTRGDLPLPPEHKLPIEIIGTEYSLEEKSPQSKKIFLRYITKPYIKVKGRRNNLKNGIFKVKGINFQSQQIYKLIMCYFWNYENL